MSKPHKFKKGSLAVRTLRALAGTRPANHRKPIDPAAARHEAFLRMIKRQMG